MSLFTNDMDTVTDALNNAFATLIQYAVEIVGMLVCIFILSWQLSLIVIAFYVLMFSYIIYSSKKSKKYYKMQQQELGKLNGYCDEIIRGEKTVKVFNHEDEAKKHFNELSSLLAESSKKAMTYALSMVPMVMFLSYVNYGIVTIVGGLMVINGVIDTVGTLSSYLVFVRQTAMPINRFTGQANLLLNALAGAERIFNLLDEPFEFDEGSVTLVHAKDVNGKLIITNDLNDPYAWNDNGKLTLLKGDVRFNNVVFEYNKDKKILHGISLYAKPGQKIAFVGSTGAGKTTIVSLINRFYEVTEGSITFDSIDVKRINKDSLRSAIGNVLQDTHLFVGTIEDNIKFGKLNATHEEVEKAAKLAHADSFISRLPDGYNTMLTTDGLNLSQGQRQLIAIARAAIANPPVLVLDEATSSIDTYTEHLIQEGMDELMKGRTVFVIAHRLSTVMNSNAIIVLEMGNIIERGEHQELLDKRGRYYSLYTGKTELQ
jgi:ATP-binding cassette subfamily B protein